ncbi:hypothetical protein ACVWWK_007744 [Bradyrhizobium sp. LB9.1b]
MLGRLGPDHEHVGDRRVRDPHLAAGEAIAVRDLLRPRLHAGWIGAGVGLGQAEAADPLAAGELRQVFLALVLVAIGVDRVHHQRGLHRVHRAVAGIDPLDLAGDEAVGDIACIGAAIFLRQRDADQAELAHLVEDLAVGRLFEIGLGDTRQQLVLGVGARGVAHHALVFGELLVEQERIVPLERSRDRLVLGLRARGHETSFRLVPSKFARQSKAPRQQVQLRCRCMGLRGSRGRASRARNDSASFRAARWRRSRYRSPTGPCSRAPKR